MFLPFLDNISQLLFPETLSTTSIKTFLSYAQRSCFQLVPLWIINYFWELFIVTWLHSDRSDVTQYGLQRLSPNLVCLQRLLPGTLLSSLQVDAVAEGAAPARLLWAQSLCSTAPSPYGAREMRGLLTATLFFKKRQRLLELTACSAIAALSVMVVGAQQAEPKVLLQCHLVSQALALVGGQKETIMTPSWYHRLKKWWEGFDHITYRNSCIFNQLSFTALCAILPFDFLSLFLSSSPQRENVWISRGKRQAKLIGW